MHVGEVHGKLSVSFQESSSQEHVRVKGMLPHKALVRWWPNGSRLVQVVEGQSSGIERTLLL